MNALAVQPAPSRRKSAPPALFRREPRSHGAYVAAWLLALAVHAAVLFGWRQASPMIEPVEFGVAIGDTSVEVELIAALPADEPIAEIVPEETPAPDPVPVVEPPQPVVEPPPIPEKPPEMTLPEPEPIPEPVVVPPPKPVAPPKPVKAQTEPKPATTANRAVGDGNSAIPGKDATSSGARAGATSAKPGYLRNPHPRYPEAARTARQQGLVLLRVQVDATGRPTSVQLNRSSGYPLLDEAARSTVAGQWRFKPARVNGTAVASNVVIPIRFALPR